MGRADGIHWGTGEGFDSDIWEILTSESPTILNEPEAAWHYAEVAARRPNGLTVWRSSPEQRPADRGWDAHVFSRDVFRNIDAHHDRTGAYPTDILLLNELNLDYERGDSKNDGGAYDTNPANWPGLYRKLATFLAQLRDECVERANDRGFYPRWWYPGWAPGHGETSDEIAALWSPGAADFGGVVLHAYTTADEIERAVRWYAERFPNHPLLVGEWNSINFGGDRLGEEMAMRIRLRQLCAEIPRLSACYFIYCWEQDSAKKTFDIKGNDQRLSLWDGRVAIPDVEPPAPPVPEPPPPEAPVPTTLPTGVDVASYQGYPDWNAVAQAGYQFAFTKVTEDTGYLNPTFEHNWARIKAAGMSRGCYHFARPGVRDAEDEADYCLRMIAEHGGLAEGDLLALDLEAGSGDLGQWVLDFLHRCEAVAGVRPLVYTGAWFSGPHNLAAYPEIGQYGLWLASYQAQMPPAPPPWQVVAFWQLSSSGRVPGIAGDVDLNVFNGPAENIKLYGKPAATPPAPSPYTVGPGILAKMAEAGDTPATDEVYVGQAYSEAFGASGARYAYIPSLNRTVRFDPAA
jgi:lysozyme